MRFLEGLERGEGGRLGLALGEPWAFEVVAGLHC